MLGYEDDGKATGMSPSELSASIKTLRVMMEAVGAKIANMQVCMYSYFILCFGACYGVFGLVWFGCVRSLQFVLVYV